MVPQFRHQMLRYEFWHFVGQKNVVVELDLKLNSIKEIWKLEINTNVTYGRIIGFLKTCQTGHDPQISQNWSILQVNVYQVRCSVIKNLNKFLTAVEQKHQRLLWLSMSDLSIDFLLVSSIQLDITSVLHIAFSESFSTFPDQTIPVSFILLWIDSTILGRFLVSESGWKVTKINQKQG